MRAAQVVGGTGQLAYWLNVTPSDLALWIKGLASPPVDVFLRAAELVAENEIIPNRHTQFNKP
jgi:DNA-binding transcriptional regulator YdaS (Cro superfamily)